MADLPVPSSFSSLSRVWTFRAICSQNPELTLETCAPKLINVITFCPSMTIGTMDTSLHCPTRWMIGSGFRKGMAGATSYFPSVWLPLYLLVLAWGWGPNARGLLLPWVAVAGQGVDHIPLVPPSLVFKADARIGHSLAMWPHPWHP